MNHDEGGNIILPRATISTKISSYKKRVRMRLWNKVPLNEKELIIGCINGDEYCQEELYEKHSSKMFGVCLRYSSDYHTAEDLLQDGFVKVFSAILSYRSEGSFEGWMRRIFVNVAIERYRKNKRVIPFEEITDHTYYLFDEEADTSLETEDLLKLIQDLPDGYREIFNLFAIEGYKHHEISEMLGISEGTSKSQLSRARNILKKKIMESNHQQNEVIEQFGQIG